MVFTYCKYTVSDTGKVSSQRTGFPAPLEGDPIEIPVLLVPYLEGRQIAEKASSSAACCRQLTIGNRPNTETSNILAVKKTQSPSDEYVLICAHRDSVFGAEGVNDNLSGTVNILAIAKAFQNVPTSRNIIFALWGGEEDGLTGSKQFYQDVIAPSDWGKSHIVSYYNIDMAAPAQKRNRVLTIHTPFKDESGNPLQSSAGDNAEKQAARLFAESEYADGIIWSEGPEDTADLLYFGNCSDHAAISGSTANPKLSFGEVIPSVYMF